MLAGCSLVSQSEPRLQPRKVEALQYYPYMVKGYQQTYPKRKIIVLMPTDDRDFKDAAGVAHSPYEGHPAVGVVLSQTAAILQHLYGPDLPQLVQGAIVGSAHEAGLASAPSDLTLEEALRLTNVNYVLMAKLTRLWVVRHRGPAPGGGAIWFTSADVNLHVAIYKPPFKIPFWQGDSDSRYNDPPLPSAGGLPEDETGIYDDPGQVLSVALTRAVAGIFKNNTLRTLIAQDTVPAS